VIKTEVLGPAPVLLDVVACDDDGHGLAALGLLPGPVAVLAAGPLEGTVALVSGKAVVLDDAADLGGAVGQEEAAVVDLVWLAAVDLDAGRRPGGPGGSML
jgi:hypothetical protein